MIFLPITKAQQQAHEISGIVYAVGLTDLQGDCIQDPEVLREASWDFMERVAAGEDVFNLNHDNSKPLRDIKVVESYVTDGDIIQKNGVKIPPYSWIMTIRIPEKIWPTIQASKGFSMEGTAEA